jgi:hypothetical protein
VNRGPGSRCAGRAVVSPWAVLTGQSVPRVRLLLALVLTVLAVPADAQDSTLRLPVRVHLLRSPSGTAITTTRTDADVRALLALANQIWIQAGIQWELESLVPTETPDGALFDSLVTGQLRATTPRLLAPFQAAARLDPGWNVFLIRDFGRIAGGAFMPELAGVILGERGFGFELPPDGRGGATLAHELGHTLGLSHVACDSTRNIMANACWRPGLPSTLTPDQIRAARSQAGTGRPAAKLPEQAPDNR